MKTYHFRNGDGIPLLGLGTWKSEPGEVGAAVREAVRIGYRHLDCSPIYGNEAEIGAALEECFAEGLVSREDMWITSKLWNNAHAREEVGPAIERTLADLGLEYLDLYLIHWPVALRPGVEYPETPEELVPLEEIPLEVTWRAMETVVHGGLSRHIGVSNFSAAKIRSLLEAGNVRPEVNQVELHPYLQQAELLDFCRREEIHVTAYSPLGSGDRPEHLKDADEPILLDDPVIRDIAATHGTTPAQVLIAWALCRRTSVIPKSVRADRLAENLAAAELELEPEDVERIAGLDRGHRYLTGEIWTRGKSPYTAESLWDE